MWLKFCILPKNKTDIGKGEIENQNPQGFHQDFAFLPCLSSLYNLHDCLFGRIAGGLSENES